MAILNRSNDASQQKWPLSFMKVQTISSGETGPLAYVPFPCTLQAAQITAFNAVSTINLIFTVSRFIAGSGVTVFNLGSTFAPSSFGTSGVLGSGVSLPAVGSTLMVLLANDVIGYQAGGGVTAAISGLAGAFVVQPIQDARVFLAGLA